MVTKIMPLGASNTYGMYQDPMSPGGYRGPLYDLLTARGASFDFVGLDKDGLLGDAEHNGYSGKPIDWFTQPANETIYDPHTGKVSTIIDTGTLSVVEYFIQQAQMTSTDVVLLLVGTNDVRLGDNAETMLKDIQVLLDQIVNSSASPFVQLMKLQPVGGDYWRETVNDRKTTNNDTIAAFNAGLEQLIADKYGALGVTLVDSGVTTATGLSSDGVHLDQTGYQMTAKAWFDSLMAAKQVVVPSAGQTTSGPTTEPTTEPTPQPIASLEGTPAGEELRGGEGDDTINGYGGNDRLFGGDGEDVFHGDAGADLLNGGLGRDTLHGGAGDGAQDVFQFNSTAESPVGAGRDVIHDFVSGIDDIDLSGIDANVWRTGEDAFKFNGTRAANYSIWYAAEQEGVTVRGDVTGDRVADFEIRLEGLTSLTASDFLL